MSLISKVNRAKVEIEYLGEHHMGCASLSFKLDRKFRGVDKFYNTNGQALFDTKLPYLIIYDARVILVFDYVKKEVYHIDSSGNSIINNVSIDNGLIIYSNSENKSLKYDLTKNRPDIGYGKVNNGRFPSAV